jgi:hypothetical protein
MRIAVEHIRRMRGGSQSHLMRCDDGSYYVVKFQNNPQGSRILANELFGTLLATRMGISVPEVAVIDVRQELIKNTYDLAVEWSNKRVPCTAGRQFGSKYPGFPPAVKTYDLIVPDQIDQTANIDDFLGVFVFDKWTCNIDKRQAILVCQNGFGVGALARNKFKAMMIDQGCCFGASAWNFPDAPLRSLYGHREVYRGVKGIEAFEPWLNWLEDRLSLDVLIDLAETIPAEWYQSDDQSLNHLVEHLYRRRTRVRDLIWSAHNVIATPFVNWAARTQFGCHGLKPFPSTYQNGKSQVPI